MKKLLLVVMIMSIVCMSSVLVFSADKIEVFNWVDYGVDESNDDVVQYLNDKFDLEIDINAVPNEYDNLVSLRIAAGDMAELTRLNDTGIYDSLYQDKYIVNVSEYVEKYNLYNLKEYLEDVPSIYKEKEGYFRIPGKKGPIQHAIYVRQDWLDRLGLEMPKTTEEFKNVAQAFAEADLDGVDATGYTSWWKTWGLKHWFVIFTGINEWGQVDGEWMTHYMHPDAKTMFAYLADMFKTGALDQEYFTLNKAQAEEKFLTGKAGFLMSTHNNYSHYKETLAKINPDAELTMLVPWLEGPNGRYKKEGSIYYGYGIIPKYISEDKKQKVLSMLDYLLSEDGVALLTFGKEGIEPYQDDVYFHTLANFVDYAKDEMLEFPDPIVRENYLHSMEVGVPLLSKEYVSDVSRDVGPAISEAKTKWFVNFIAGDADVETEWADYVAEIKAAGYDKLVEDFSKWAEKVNLQ